MTEEYSGLPGAYAFAFRRSNSWIFRSYVIVSALLGVLIVLLIAMAVVQWTLNPSGLFGERAMLGVIAIAVLVPLFAPVLLVARRRRRASTGSLDDAVFGAAGYLVVISLWLGVVITVPDATAEPGPFRPVVAFLYGLPSVYGIVPPVVAIGVLVVLYYRTKSRHDVDHPSE